jgi:hypothetical protein
MSAICAAASAASGLAGRSAASIIARRRIGQDLMSRGDGLIEGL